MLRDRVCVPILMYHSISDSRGQNGHPYFHTGTSSCVFEQQMKFLHENNYSAINLDEVVKYVESGGLPTGKPVVITFDDGFQDFYTIAFPILQRYGFAATVFLPTGYIHRRAQSFRGKECLTWNQVRELHKLGVNFGSHTVTHPQLRFEEANTIEHELRVSKEVIENELGTSIDSFSYPFAFPEVNFDFRQRLKSILEANAYRNGVSTILGTVTRADDKFFLKRLPVNSWDDPSLFSAKLEGAYDWLHQAQHAVKLVKSKLY